MFLKSLTGQYKCMHVQRYHGGFTLMSSGYKIPRCKTVDEYKTFIDSLPMVDSPETFGLHYNADITYYIFTAILFAQSSQQTRHHYNHLNDFTLIVIHYFM